MFLGGVVHCDPMGKTLQKRPMKNDEQSAKDRQRYPRPSSPTWGIGISITVLTHEGLPRLHEAKAQIQGFRARQSCPISLFQCLHIDRFTWPISMQISGASP